MVPKLFRQFADASHDFPDFVSVALALHPRFTLDFTRAFSRYPSLSSLLANGLTPPCSAQFYKLSLLKQNRIFYNSKITSGIDHDLWFTLSWQVNPIVSVVWTPHLPLVGTSSERITGSPQRFKKILFSISQWSSAINHLFFDGYERLLTDSYYHQCKRELFVREFTRRDFKRLLLFSFLYLPSCFYRLFFKFRRPGYGFVTFEKLLRP